MTDPRIDSIHQKISELMDECTSKDKFVDQVLQFYKQKFDPDTYIDDTIITYSFLYRNHKYLVELNWIGYMNALVDECSRLIPKFKEIYMLNVDYPKNIIRIAIDVMTITINDIIQHLSTVSNL